MSLAVQIPMPRMPEARLAMAHSPAAPRTHSLKQGQILRPHFMEAAPGMRGS